MRPLLSSFFLITTLTGPAQQAEVSRYDVDQGLPQSMVNHVLQDADGFIWLGTGNGLARFDGQRFVVYKHEAEDRHSLSHNSIWGLAQRDPRSLWVGTRSGLDVLDLRTGRLERVATGDDEHDGCWRPLRTAPGDALFYSPLLHSMLRIGDGPAARTELAHIDSYTLRLSGDGSTLHQYIRPDSLVSITMPGGEEHMRRIPVRNSERICDMIALGEGWLVLTDTGGWIWNGVAERTELHDELYDLLHAVPGRKLAERAPDGRLWIAISGVGVVALNDDFSIRSHHPLLPPEQRPLNFTCLAFDRQGNTWVGTDGKGVFKIAPQRVLFGRAMPGQGAAWEPSSWFVRGFAQWDSTHVLVSFFEGGLALFDERTHRLAPLLLPAQPADMTPLNDQQGRIWYTEGNSTRALDPASSRVVYDRSFECQPVVARMLGGGMSVGSVCEPFAEVIDGPGPPRLATLNARPLQHVLDSAYTMPHHYFVDRARRIWLSTDQVPFSVWSPKGRVPLASGTDAAPGDQVRLSDMAEDDQAIWCATNEGLWKWRSADLALLDHLTVHDGLPDQYLLALLPGGDGTFWLSSYNGLSHFDPARNSITNYGTIDGVQSKEFNGRAAFRSRSGRLYFGGINGFNHFMPEAPLLDTDSARVHLIGLTVQDSIIDLRALGPIPHIKLAYGRNSVTIEVTVLEFTAPDRNTYRYRIPGYAEWTTLTPDRPISLANMPAGEYAVQVAGVNGHGAVSAPRELITISVPLPFWASPWAHVLIGSGVVALAAGGAFLIYRRRMQRQQERTEQQLKELRIRTRIAQDLHDDVGSGLARISALAHMAEKRTASGDAPTDQVTKVKAISQELMDNLRDVVWVNDPKEGELAALLLRLKDHVRDLFEPSNVECVFHLPEPLPERRIGSTFKRNAFLLMKEAAHNAFKYSGTTRVELAFALNGDHFILRLKDHGRGMTSGPPRGTGHGLKNMRSRAEELGASLTVHGVVDEGTEVVLNGPPACLDL